MLFILDTFYENLCNFFIYDIYYTFNPSLKLIEEYLDKLYSL